MKRLLPLPMILLACFMTVVRIYIYPLIRRESVRSRQLEYEANVTMGDIPGKSVEERQRGLNSAAGEGTLSMSTNVIPSGYAGGRDKAVNWLIENPSNQGKLVHVEITRDDMGELIYRTGAIRPGSYIEPAEPLLEMSAGVYDCTAIFYAYKVETEELTGRATVSARLTLSERGEGESYRRNWQYV